MEFGLRFGVDKVINSINYRLVPYRTTTYRFIICTGTTGTSLPAISGGTLQVLPVLLNQTTTLTIFISAVKLCMDKH